MSPCFIFLYEENPTIQTIVATIPATNAEWRRRDREFESVIEASGITGPSCRTGTISQPVTNSTTENIMIIPKIPNSGGIVRLILLDIIRMVMNCLVVSLTISIPSSGVSVGGRSLSRRKAFGKGHHTAIQRWDPPSENWSQSFGPRRSTQTVNPSSLDRCSNPGQRWRAKPGI